METKNKKRKKGNTTLIILIVLIIVIVVLYFLLPSGKQNPPSIEERIETSEPADKTRMEPEELEIPVTDSEV